MSLDCIRNHQTSTAKPLRSGLELCRPHHGGVRFALESDCRGTGGAHLQVNGGPLNTISAMEPVTALALPAIALCLARRLFCGFPGIPPQACTEIASADKRTASVPHMMLASRPSMPPSRSTTPKRSRFGLAAGSAGHAAGSAAVAALRRGNIANAFRCAPAVPAD